MFSPETGLASLSVRQVGNSRRPFLQLVGSLKLEDGTEIPLGVTSRKIQRAPQRPSIAYRFKGGGPGHPRAQGRMVLVGCPADSVAYFHMVVLPGAGRTTLTLSDPSTVTMGAQGSRASMVLTAADLHDLTVDPGDSSHLIFPNDDPLLQDVTAGTILVAGRTPNTPRGLLRKIVDVVPGRQSTMLVTQPATLTEAFDYLNFEIGESAPASAVGGAPRLTVKTCLDASFGPASFMRDLSTHTTPNVSASFEADIGADATLCLMGHVEFRVRLVDDIFPVGVDFTHKSMSAELTGGIDGRVHGEISEAASLGFERMVLDEFVLPPIEALPIPVIGDLILITPSLQLIATAQAHVEAGVSVDAHGSLVVDFGFQCTDDTGCELIHDFTPILNGSADPSGTADLFLFIGPNLHVTVDDSDLVSADLGAGAFGEAEANINADPWWQLRAGFQVLINVAADFVGTLYNQVFFPVDEIIASASGPFDTTTTTVTSTSITATTVTSSTGTSTTTLASGLITTIAGNGTSGFSGDGGPATSAELGLPLGIAIDHSTGNLYIADNTNDVVRLVVANTGIISTIAGSGDFGYSGDGGSALAASLGAPVDVAVDASGNLFIADYCNQAIRRVDAQTRVITTAVSDVGEIGRIRFDGSGRLLISINYDHASFGGCTSAAVRPRIIVFTGSIVQRVDLTTGTRQVVAGDGDFGESGDGGAATAAELNDPMGLALSGGDLLIADVENDRVRRVDAFGTITTFAGTGVHGFSGDGGPAVFANLGHPLDVAFDLQGRLVIDDVSNNRIRRIDAGGTITTIAGNGIEGGIGDGGPATTAELDTPQAIAIAPDGSIVVADTLNYRIRRVVP